MAIRARAEVDNRRVDGWRVGTQGCTELESASGYFGPCLRSDRGTL